MKREEFFALIKSRKIDYPELKCGIESAVGEMLYDFVIEYGVRRIVETGICHGFSSWYFLEALQHTNGKLWSVEPVIQESIVVPDVLRSRWTIYNKVSPQALYGIFSELNEVDLFWHDSLHTFGVQLGEYAIASKHAKYVGTHDVNKTGAWMIFLDLYKWKEVKSRHTFAIASRNGA